MCISVSEVGGRPARPNGDDADTDHVYTTPHEPYVNWSSDNDSPNIKLSTLPQRPQGASSSDCNHLQMKGSTVVASVSTAADTYDHTEAPEGRKPLPVQGECSALNGGQKSKPSASAKQKTNTVYGNSAVKCTHFGGVDKSKTSRLQDQGEHPLTEAVDASAEAAAIYATAGTTDYETVNDDGRFVMSPSDPSGDVYNRLRGPAGRSVEQEVHQNHYDHFNDPAGTGPEYSSLDHGDRARDQQREMAASEYSHV